MGSPYGGARFYSPALGRFLSADTIVPGAADGSGGGAATLGYDKATRLTPLSTDFHEFIAQVGSENAEVLQYGPFFMWSDKVRQEHNVPMGPLNPQALNRYSYVLNNPLRYVDPTGHNRIKFTFVLTFNASAWTTFMDLIDGCRSDIETEGFQAMVAAEVTAAAAAGVTTLLTGGLGTGAAPLSQGFVVGVEANYVSAANELAQVLSAFAVDTGIEFGPTGHDVFHLIVEMTQEGNNVTYRLSSLNRPRQFIEISCGPLVCAGQYFSKALDKIIMQQTRLGITPAPISWHESTFRLYQGYSQVK